MTRCHFCLWQDETIEPARINPQCDQTPPQKHWKLREDTFWQLVRFLNCFSRASLKLCGGPVWSKKIDHQKPCGYDGFWMRLTILLGAPAFPKSSPRKSNVFFRDGPFPQLTSPLTLVCNSVYTILGLSVPCYSNSYFSNSSKIVFLVVTDCSFW